MFDPPRNDSLSGRGTLPRQAAPNSLLILFVADFLQPIHGFAIKLFLDGNVGERGSRRRAMPMLLARGEPDNVAWPDFFDRTFPALHPTETGGDDQRLAERVGVPGGSSPRLEGDDGARNSGWFCRLEGGIDSDRACEPIGGTFAGRLRAGSLDVHLRSFC